MPQFPSVSGASGIWPLKKQKRAAQGSNWPTLSGADANFNQVTLLLPGNGTNGAQNNTFLDSSTNNFTITRNGNTTQGTFTPYEPNWSVYFNGSTAIYADNSYAKPGFTIGTNDFTIEFWANSSSTTTQSVLGTYRSVFPSGTGFTVNITGGTTINFSYGSTVIVSAAGVWVRSRWNHVAVCRVNGITKIFLNGVAVGAAYDTNNYIYQSNFYYQTFFIGRRADDGSGALWYTGWLSNVRFVNGTGLYANNFTPSTEPLTAVTNTVVLTCQNNQIVDNSNNGWWMVTANGTPSVQSYNPFISYPIYSPAVNGGSAYFDANGDYLNAGDQTAFEFGSGDYTVELWWYPTSSGNQNLIGKWDASGSEWILQWRSAGYYRWASGGSVRSDSATMTLALNTWNHVVVTKTGTSLRIYTNGVQINTTATEGTISATSASLTIGDAQIPASPAPVAGYMSDVRVLKGTALYTGATYVVPTTPLTAITNTSLLLNFTNGAIIDYSMVGNVLETVGNAQISTAVSKFGGGSMAFDGTGDWLTMPNSRGLYIGSGDFTVEGWLYLNATGSTKSIVSQFNSNGTGPGWTLYITSANVLEFYGGIGTVTVTGTTAIAATTWTHFAVVRSGSTITIYVNGVAGGTATNSSFNDDTTALGYVGGRADSAALSLNGYIDDLRITRGFARYTSNFSVPTLPFPTQ